MRICKVWDSEYPWDVRAQKVALSLTRAGHEVHLVARNRDGRPCLESREEATVHRMAPLPLGGAGLNRASMFPAFFNPRWVRLIRSVASETEADVIVCRDLPLAPTSLFVGRLLSLPVVLDMAENYPAMIEAVWVHRRHRLLDWVVRNPAAVRWVEHWVIRRADHIVVVVEESRDRLVAMGVPESRITVVLNTPLDRRIPSSAGGAPPTPPLKLVYIGILEAPRGLEVVMEALARCRELTVPVQCSIVGDGRDRSLLVEKARTLGLTDREVRFHGRLPYEEALQVVQSSHAGIVPHLANASWHSTIPNKLFDYMSAGIPVITSDAKPAARIVSETACGEVYGSSDPAGLVDAIRRLCDQSRRERLGKAGRRAVLEKFRWSKDGARFVEAVEGVVVGR